MGARCKLTTKGNPEVLSKCISNHLSCCRRTGTTLTKFKPVPLPAYPNMSNMARKGFSQSAPNHSPSFHGQTTSCSVERSESLQRHHWRPRRRDARNSFSAEEKSLQSQWLAGAGADTKDRKVMPQHASTTVVQWYVIMLWFPTPWNNMKHLKLTKPCFTFQRLWRSKRMDLSWQDLLRLFLLVLHVFAWFCWSFFLGGQVWDWHQLLLN